MTSGKLKRSDVPQRIGLMADGRWGFDVPFDHIERQLERALVNDAGEAPVLVPGYQRGRVWSEEQGRRWIEHRLSGGLAGHQIFWNEYPCGRIELVDGLQRLSAAREFVAGRLRVFTGLRGQADGWAWSEMSQGIRRGVDMRWDVNRLETRARVLKWYLEINAGGTPHVPAELARVRALLDDEMRREST